MEQTCGRICSVTASATDAHAKPPLREPAHHQEAPLHRTPLDLVGHIISAAAAVLVTYCVAVTAWRVRHEPQDLAFVVGAGLLLAALLACLRRAERLTPDSPAGERRRVQAAVWAVSTVLSCAFAYRVAAVMPPALAVLVWCMTAVVVLTGLFLLVLCKDQQQQYQALDNVDCDPAGDGKPFKKINPADELV